MREPFKSDIGSQVLSLFWVWYRYYRNPYAQLEDSRYFEQLAWEWIERNPTYGYISALIAYEVMKEEKDPPIYVKNMLDTIFDDLFDWGNDRVLCGE